MLSKSKEWNKNGWSTFIISSSWGVSVSIHLAIIASAILVNCIFSVKKQEINFEVYDQPILKNNANLPRALKATPKLKTEKTQKSNFGLSKSIHSSPQGAVEKAGNTLAKVPDRKSSSDDKGLPIPTDEYLVSQMPELITEFRADYPPEAKQRGIQGAVTLDLLIDDQGEVRNISFISGPGFGLNEAAQEAVKKFKFKPAIVQDKPVAVRIRYVYRFVLE